MGINHIDQLEFQGLITSPKKLIVFIFHGWSGYSVASKNIIDNWEARTKREIFLIDATTLSYHDDFPSWIRAQEKDDWFESSVMKIKRYSPRNRIHGYGEIVWIEDKQVVGFECIFQSYDFETLEARTKELFRE